MSNSLQPHELQHTKLCSPSLSPGVCLNSCPLSQWCYLTISSSVMPFSFCLQSFPASWSFSVSQPFTSGGQSIGTSASASISPSNEYAGLTSFRIDRFDLLTVQGPSGSSPAPQFESINVLAWLRSSLLYIAFTVSSVFLKYFILAVIRYLLLS